MEAVIRAPIACDNPPPMLLTSPSPSRLATDLGYLLHKHPGASSTRRRWRSAKAHVFYPEADERAMHRRAAAGRRPGRARRGSGRRPGPALEPYVNDRPYVASSFL